MRWWRVAYSVFSLFWPISISKFFLSGTKMLFLKLVERGAHNTMNICSNLGATKSQLSPFSPPPQIFQPSTLSHLPSSYPPSQIFQPTIPLPPPDHKIFQQDPLTRPPVTSFTSTSPCKILAHICQIPVKVVKISLSNFLSWIFSWKTYRLIGSNIDGIDVK